jgi:hypothetical protein
METDIMCPVCREKYNTFLSLAKHMLLKEGGLAGDHIEWLKGFRRCTLDKLISDKEKKIAIDLARYWKKHGSWPSIEWTGEEYGD